MNEQDESSQSYEKSKIEELVHNSKIFEENFEYKKYLGGGGFGKVIQVRNKIDNKDYAMKIIELPLEYKTEMKEYAVEAQYLSKLCHPNIVQYNTTFIDSFPYLSDSDEEESDYSGESTDSSADGLSFRMSRIVIQSDSSFDEYFGLGQIPSSIRGRSALFIQMEFCENKTLKHMINDKKLYKDVNLIKILLRQIIDALEYIHSKEIIHRDLKPENIFITQKSVIKVGDFGLAKSGNNTSSETQSSSEEVGTPYYIAPEVKEGLIYGPFNDIYSLGIILFEMVHEPFQTDSERCEVLSPLRTKSVLMPEGIFKGETLALHEMTKSMLSHDFNSRPSAKMLSDSDVLPPRSGEPCALELIRSIVEGPDTLKRQQLFHEIFNSSNSEKILKQYEEQNSTNTELVDQQYVLVMNDIIDRMTEVFRIHGAVRLSLPILLPKTTRTSYNVLTQTGYFQSLPCNLKNNLVQYIIKNDIWNKKRYCFSQVFEKQPSVRAKNPNPKDTLKASFDIISSGSEIIAAGEVLQVAFHVLSNLPYFKDFKKKIYINHTAIIKSILLSFDIKEVDHDGIFQKLFSNNGKIGNKSLQARGMLNSDSRKELMKIFMMEGAIYDILEQPLLKGIYNRMNEDNKMQFEHGLRNVIQILLLACNSSSPDNDIGFTDSEDIFLLLNKLRKTLLLEEYRRLVKIRFSLINDLCTYSDFMFKLVLQVQRRKGRKKYTTIALGGNFTCLFDKFKSGSTTITPRLCSSAFGITFLLEDIAQMEKEVRLNLNNREKEVDLAKSCSVLIFGSSGTSSSLNSKEAFLIHKMLKILWGYEIKAQRHQNGDHVTTYNHLVKFNSKDSSILIKSDPFITQNIKKRDGQNGTEFFKDDQLSEAINYIVQWELQFKQFKAERIITSNSSNRRSSLSEKLLKSNEINNRTNRRSTSKKRSTKRKN